MSHVGFGNCLYAGYRAALALTNSPPPASGCTCIAQDIDVLVGIDILIWRHRAIRDVRDQHIRYVAQRRLAQFNQAGRIRPEQRRADAPCGRGPRRVPWRYSASKGDVTHERHMHQVFWETADRSAKKLLTWEQSLTRRALQILEHWLERVKGIEPSS
jgi:hypothetical protein